MSIATGRKTATSAAAAAAPSAPPAQVPPAHQQQPGQRPPAESPATRGPVRRPFRGGRGLAGGRAEPEETTPASAVERALAAAIEDASRIGELLEVLRTARLWLPLPDDGSPAITGTAVILPTVSYLGTDFVAAYSSADLLHELAGGPALAGRADQSAALPYAVVRAADLARLLPPAIGIALNAGARESVPLYPQGVSFLAAEDTGSDLHRITVGPLPVRPDGLLADIAAGLIQIAAVRDASASWLSVQFAGEGLLISVSLDIPGDGRVQDLVTGAIERAAWQAAPQDISFPIEVTFPGQVAPDELDARAAALGTPFYRREAAALPGSTAASR